MELTKKKALYVRKSREGEHGAEDTLFTQRESLLRYAKGKGYKDVDVYEEIESSIEWNRPELSRLVTGLENGIYSTIIVAHLDAW